MRLKPQYWCLVSLLLFAAAICLWRVAPNNTGQHVVKQNTSLSAHPPLVKTSAAQIATKPKSYRLSNTTQSLTHLIHNPHALILRNALIDTEVAVPLNIPEHLRARGAPGSYLVQADHTLDKQFYAELKNAGAVYVSYVPNNAALVEASPTVATNLSRLPDVITVLPYDPYYKLDATLLPQAVDQQPEADELSVTTFPGQRNAALTALTQLGAKLIGEDSGPFGPTLVISVPPQNLVAVAQLPFTQEVEVRAQRRLMNDLTRVLMGEAPNTLIGTSNYFGLTGSNVTVNINDTGVDVTHPDFGTNRLLGNPGALVDYDGHGTHVAGIIAGSGLESTTVPAPPATNIPGSVLGATFQGKATNAFLFVQSLSLTYGPYISDSYLQQNASVNLGPTNLISNNSWDYGGSTVYDTHAASYDAATRDAQPKVDGEQPLLFVFAAGDGGDNSVTGTIGPSGTINSPATAKNVITVGTSDSPRFITNQVSTDCLTTNDIFYGESDNADLVAPFSGCGPVDVGVEGTYGRFKPDVVAPGVFTVSCRSTNFNDPAYETSISDKSYPQQTVDLKQTNSDYIVYLPGNTEQLVVIITSNAASPQPFPTNMILLGDTNGPTTTVLSSNLFWPNVFVVTNLATNTLWTFGVAAPTNANGPVSYDINFYVYTTNYECTYFTVLSNLNVGLKPYYRYASGTSMSAGAVSGMLALFQEYVQTKLGMTNPSPALLKAMLINSSRSLGGQYDFNLQPSGGNAQGWGLPYLTNDLKGLITNAPASTVLIDQSPTNALATGQYQTYIINCSDTNTLLYPFRFTLVWTDPPGNPAAGIALVNDLDLTVADATGTNVYIGNDFLSGDTYTEVNSPTNLPAGQNDNTTENYYVINGNVSNTVAGDPINNVQNIYISPVYPVQFPLTVTVCGTRVNVNAVTTQTNNILQDFALVISSDDPLLAEPLTITTNGITNANPVLITIASNGIPLLHERVGANEPDLYNYTNGLTNGNFSQWHFFIFTNSELVVSNTTNVAFATFEPPNLSIPRVSGADIDLYVYAPATPLTNFASFIINTNNFATFTESAYKSLNRGGNESVIFTNSTVPVYYVGVKSEDQQAADFGFYAVAQQQPFSELSSSGNTITAPGTSLPVAIPTAVTPAPALAFAFVVNPNPVLNMVRRVTPTVGVAFPNPGNLEGTLQHEGLTTVVNNYTGFLGGFTNTYDDLGEDPASGDTPTDSSPPYNLTQYINQPADGMWLLTEANNSLTLTGDVTEFSVSVDLQEPQTGGFFISIPAQSWFDDYVYVPNDATNMVIYALYENSGTNLAGTGPIGIFVTNEPGTITTSDYGSNNISPPGGSLTLSTNPPFGPPLAGGYWYYGIYNYGSQPVSLYVQVLFGETLTPNLVQTYTNTTPTPLTTDAHTQSQICITNDNPIVALQVGVVIYDTNLDDLVLHLTSPEGTSVDLFEDRGGLVATNLGLELLLTNGVTVTNVNGTNIYTTNYVTNFIYTVFTENTNLTTNVIKFAPPPFAAATYMPFTNLWSNSFETVPPGIYTNSGSNGLTLEGWLVTNTIATIPTTNGPGFLTNNAVGIVTDPNGDQIGPVNLGSNYLALTSGRIVQTFPGSNISFSVTNGMPYQLQFYVKPLGIVDWWPGDNSATDIIGTNSGVLVDTNVTFGAGEVHEAFAFSGVSSNNTDVGDEVDFGTNAGNFGTNDFTVDFWIEEPNIATGQFAILEKRVPGCDLNTNMWDILSTNGHLFLEISDDGGANYVGLTNTNTSIDNGVFHYAAFTRMGATLSIYVDGVLATNTTAPGIENIANPSMFRAGQSVCVGNVPGYYPFEGSLDELDLYNRALSPAEIYAIYHAGSLGKYNTNSLLPNFQLSLDGISTNTITLTNASESWQLMTNSFIANGSDVTIEFIGNTLGVLLDDIQLYQLPATNYNNYYAPEEPLTPFVGENPLGCWTLDVWDTRNDSPLPTNGTLLSWTLQLTTSATNASLTVLSNQNSFTTNVTTNGVAYFGIDVPPYATIATNILTTLSGGPLTLLFDQTALPTGGLPGDFTLTNGVAAGTSSTNILYSAGGLPPLLPGQRYFLGVVNNSGTANATFSIQVNFNVLTNAIIPLTNQIQYSNTIGTNTIGINGPQYYSFVVPVNASMVTFQILNPTNGQVDLYASDGLPVPGPDSYAYASENAGAVDQFIAVTTNSAPIPLPTTNSALPEFPSTWYLSVYNPAGLSNITYTIVATVVTNGQVTVIPLSNAVPTNNIAAPGYPDDVFYSFTVTNSPAGVQFTVTNLTNFGTVELLASLDTYPTAETFYAGSFNSGTNSQFIQISPNAELPSLNGTWYLAVPNTAPSNILYSIEAMTNSIVPPAIVPLIWTGSVDDYWDILTTSNWAVSGTAPPQAYPYQDGSRVTFDNTSTVRNVNLTTALDPLKVIVSGSNYTFFGSGGIFGAPMNVTGSLILDNTANNFSTVNLTTGTLQIGNGDTLGSLATNGGVLGTNSTFNIGGTLVFDRADNITITNVLTGAGNLEQIGTNMLTLAGTNTFSGFTYIGGGSVVVDNTNALGSWTGLGVLIDVGGTLDLSGLNTSNGIGDPLFGQLEFDIGGNGFDGNGAIVNNGPYAQEGGFENLSLFTNAAIGGATRWDIRNTAAPYLLFGNTLTKLGANQIDIVDLGLDSGNIVIDQGLLSFEGATGLNAGGITVNPGGLLGTISITYSNFTAPVVLNGGGITNLSGGGTNFFDGTILLSNNSFLGNGAGIEIFDDVISGAATLTNLGIGTNLFAATNIYTGPTIIAQGDFGLISNGCISNSSSILVESNAALDATLRIDETFTLYSNQMLIDDGIVLGSDVVIGSNSILIGNGCVNTNLTLEPGSYFTPGPDGISIGALTVSNTVMLGGTNYMKINKGLSPSNDVVMASNIVYGGLLIVTNLNTNPAVAFVPGDSFTLYNVSNSSGAVPAFLTNIILPQLPPRLAWSNSFAISGPGIITVVTNTNYVPPFPIVALTWNGDIDGNWDVLITSNWVVTTNLGQSYAYEDGCAVTFDDNAFGTRTINVTTSVVPASVTVNESFAPYSFVGVGAINGAPLMILSGMLTLDNATNSFTSVTLDNGGTLQIGNGDTLGSLSLFGGILGSGTFTNNGTLAFDRSDNITVTNLITGSGGLQQLGPDTVTLTAADDYTNSTYVGSGTLAFGTGGTITASPIEVASGATLANVSAGAISIGGVTTFDPGANILFTDTNGLIGKIRIATNLTLNDNNITVNVNGAALGLGDYRVMNCSGTLTGTAGAVTLVGTVNSNYTASAITTQGAGGNITLVVSATPIFTNLVSAPSITYGATNITLGGAVLFANGGSNIYATNGDAVSVTINGYTINGTITGPNGAFSINYSDPSLPTDGVANSPYTITYVYGGNSSLFLSPATNTATSLTINPLPVVLTGSRYYNGTATAVASILSVSNAINGDTVNAASGSATLFSANVGMEQITSFATLTLGGAQAANYTLVGASGAVTINAVPPFSIIAESIDQTGANLIITWQSTATVTYHVVESPTLEAPLSAWTQIGSSVVATGATASATNPITPPFEFFEVVSP